METFADPRTADSGWQAVCKDAVGSTPVLTCLHVFVSPLVVIRFCCIKDLCCLTDEEEYGLATLQPWSVRFPLLISAHVIFFCLLQ